MRHLIPIFALLLGLALGGAVAPATAQAPDPCAPTATTTTITATATPSATATATPTATSSSTPTATPSPTPGSTYLPFVVYGDAFGPGWSRQAPGGWTASWGMTSVAEVASPTYAGSKAWKLVYQRWGGFQVMANPPADLRGYTALTFALQGAGRYEVYVQHAGGTAVLGQVTAGPSWASVRLSLPPGLTGVSELVFKEAPGNATTLYLDEIALEGQAGTSPTPTGTSAPATPSATRTPAPAGGTVRIMPLGDSITEGGAGGYRTTLWERLTAAGWSVNYVGPNYDPYTTTPDKDHAGTPGFNTGNILDNLDEYLSAYQPDIVLLLIGTNDLSWWTADLAVASSTAARVGLIIDQVRASGATVYLATTPPARGGNVPIVNLDRAQLVRDYNAQLRQLAAAKGVTLVDVEAGLTLADISDDVHPTAAGYAKIGELWAAALLAQQP